MTTEKKGFRKLWKKEKKLGHCIFFSTYNNFDFMKNKFHVFDLHLTLYQTVLTFNDPEEEAFQKHCW